MQKVKNRTRCEGSGRLPTVERPGPHTWSSVIHHCPHCGRRWGKNAGNNGWEKLPIPMHYRPLQLGRMRGYPMQEYVAGLLFDESKSYVALILKTHPDWQAGKLNAIGGRIETEKNESPMDAMRREFKEETGLDVQDWRQFATLADERGWAVRFYWAMGKPWECRQTTDEQPFLAIVGSLPENIIPNLRWLIPMALSMESERCDELMIREFKSCKGLKVGQ